MNKLDTYLNFIEKTPYKYSRLIEFEKELYQKYGTGIVLPIWYFLNEMETKELIYLNSIHIIDHKQKLFFIKKDSEQYICKISGELQPDDKNIDSLRMKIQKINDITLKQAIENNKYIFKDDYKEQNFVHSINSGSYINGFCSYGYKGDIPFDGTDLIEIASECYQHITDNKKDKIQHIINLLIEKAEKSDSYEYCPFLNDWFDESMGIPGELELALIHKIRTKTLESLIHDIWKGYDVLKKLHKSKENNYIEIETQNFQVIFDIEKEELITSKIIIEDDIKLSNHLNIKRNEPPNSLTLETISRFQYIHDMAGIIDLIKKPDINKLSF